MGSINSSSHGGRHGPAPLSQYVQVSERAVGVLGVSGMEKLMAANCKTTVTFRVLAFPTKTRPKMLWCR